jgi:cytochrome P450
MLPKIDAKLRLEMKEKFKNWGKSNEDLAEEINIESCEELEYLKMCFNEALRIESPLPFATTAMITEDQ